MEKDGRFGAEQVLLDFGSRTGGPLPPRGRGFGKERPQRALNIGRQDTLEVFKGSTAEVGIGGVKAVVSDAQRMGREDQGKQGEDIFEAQAAGAFERTEDGGRKLVAGGGIDNP